MKRLALLLIAAIVLLMQNAYAQNAPAAIGNTSGSDGNPKLLFWLVADSIQGLNDGDDVSSWTDLSGNNISFGASGASGTVLPKFADGAFNGHDAVRFSSNSASVTSALVHKPFDNFFTDQFTVFVVMNTSDGGSGVLSYNTSSADNEFLLFDPSALRIFVNSSNKSSGIAYNDGNNTILFTRWKSSGGNVNAERDGGNSTYSSTLQNGATLEQSGCLAIGGEQDAYDGGYQEDQAFDGDIAEVIVYASYLNTAEKTIIDNYLNLKYGITIADDKYTANDAAYIYGFTGIGQESDGYRQKSGSDGFYVEASLGVLDDGEYAMFAHNNAANSSSTIVTTGLPTGVEAAWNRSWYIEKTGNFDANIYFDFDEGLTDGKYPIGTSNYVLLFKANTSDSWTILKSGADGIADGDRVYFSLNDADLQNGYYTIGTLDEANSPVEGADGRNWYTLASGDWDDWEIWTLDPSGALPNNPNHETPTTSSTSTADKVFILTGKNVTVTANNKINAEITVYGTLDLGTTSGHSFGKINGTGIIKMAADNFPSGDATHFYSADQGAGKVIYYGGSYNLATARTFYNMEIDLDDPSNTVTLLADYSINGDLEIKQGILKINDDASTTNLNITVRGDFAVRSNAQVQTGTGNARHEFNFYGDFLNQGVVKFTNRTAQDLDNEATDGIVDANFLSGKQDQQITCENTTNFYRIEIKKGRDETYVLNIDATQAGYFNLFGPANYNLDNYVSGDTLEDNPNALGLIKGTVRLGSNITVNELTKSGNYDISALARLWIDGAYVKNTGNAIVPYGEFKITRGTLDNYVTNGLTLRSSGTIRVDGGTVNTNQIRTSTQGASAQGAYIQTGGTVNVYGYNTSLTDYYAFNLTYPGNIFSMSGGTLHIYDANGTSGSSGGIFINSDPSNINVTGGTVICEIAQTNRPFKITSRAPFWNLILRNTYDNTTDHVLDAGTDVGTTDEDLAAQPLVVLNDLTIEDNAFLDNNNKNITVSRNFYIAENAQKDDAGSSTNNYGLAYEPADDYRLTFDGDETGYFTIYYNNNDPYELYVPVLVLNKNYDTSRVIMKAGPQKDPTVVDKEWYNRILHVEDTTFIIKGILDQGRQSVRTFGEVYVYKNGQLGRYVNGVTPLTAYIIFRDGSGLTIHSEKGAKFGNLKFNNADTVHFASDVEIGRIGYYTGSYNIHGYNLKVKYLQKNATTDNFTVGAGNEDKMIYSDGKAGDGGVSLFIPAGTPDGTRFTIPVGTKASNIKRYTPVRIEVYNVPADDSGYIQVRPVDDVLKTTNLNGGDILSYYWRVSYEGFSKGTKPKIIWRFYYSDSDDDNGSEANFVAGRVDDNFPFNRTYEDDPNPKLSSVDETNNYINFNGDGSGIELDSICFTAGEYTRFEGQVDVYYMHWKNAYWEDAEHWHKNSKTGPVGEVPQEGSVAVLYSDADTVTRVWASNLKNLPKPAMIIFQIDRNAYPDVTTENQPRLQFNTSGTYELGRISGPGMVSINVRRGPVVHADLGDFARDSCATLMYGWQNYTGTLNDILEPIPNLMFETSTFTIDQELDINYDLILQGDCDITFNKDVTVGRNLYIGYWEGGNLHFPGSGNPVTFTVKGNIDFSLLQSAYNTRRIIVDDPGSASTLTHKLIVYGDINMANNTDFSIDLYNAADRPVVVLELAGDTSARLYNAATTPDLYRIVMNKGNSQDLYFSFDNNFTLNGPASGDTKAIELKNGTLILNHADIDVALSTGGADFYIPSTSALVVKQGKATVSGDDNGILLDGKLNIAGGTLDMATGSGNGNNYIQYSGSGNATIELTDGLLRVGSQVRRGITSDEGILKYYQSGGTAYFGIKAGGTDKRSIFEVVNDGSVFSLTGGTFAIVNDLRTNPQSATLYLNPQNQTIASNHPVIFGTSETVATGEDFTLYAANPIERLEIDNPANVEPKLTLTSVPLVLNGDLFIDNNATFDANGLDVNIRGYWTNNGDYVANGNKVTFDGTNPQQIRGATEFYDLYKTSGNNVSIEDGSTLTVDNYLSLEDGYFDTKTGSIVAKGNVFSSITMYSSGKTDNGLIFRGDRQQVLSGNGKFDRLMIDNIYGVQVPTGYTIEVNDSLMLSKGVFDIGKNLLVLTKGADIIPVNPYSSTNMIQTNISFTDAGIKKYFPAISSATKFIYPIGSNGKYTPVVFDITTFSPDNACIRVKSADERHPSIQEDDEAPDPEIVDSLNVLQYYWIMDATGVTDFTAKVTMQAVHKDVWFTNPYDSTDYITARLLSRNSGLWDKYLPEDFNETTDELYFHFDGTNDPGIDGDYTAGVDGSSFNGAIPDQVPLYVTQKDGDWTDVTVWDPTPPAGGPKGARVLIKHTVTVPKNYIVSYTTTIDATGTLDVGTTFGHRLGVVSGTGLLRIARGELPAGDYDDFFAPDSGTVEFYGTTDYDILSEIPAVNNLIVSGSGERRFPNLDLQIYGNLTIDGANAVDLYNRTIKIAKNLTFNSGNFTAQQGKIVFNGTARQYILGTTSFTAPNDFYDFEIDNTYGVELQTQAEISNNLIFTAGQIFTTTTNLLTITNTGDDPVTGAGYGKFVDGPLAKKIINGHPFDFPVGNNGRYGNVLVTVPTSVGNTYTWIAQYYDKNPGNDGYDPSSYASPLQYVSTNEYWRVWTGAPSSASPTAKVRLRWDSQSGVPSTASDRDNYLEIARWNFSNSQWEKEDATIVDNTDNGTIETDNNITFNDDATQGDVLTLASNYFESFDWNGSDDTVWTNTANWSGGKVPGSFNDVVIKATASNFPAITGTDAEVKNLTIEDGAKLTIYPGASLTVSSDLTINGTLIMQAPGGTGSYPSLFTNGNITFGTNGKFQEKLYLTAKSYHYVSSPIQAGGNATSDLFCKNRPDGRFNANFYSYDETADLDGNPSTCPPGDYNSQYLANGWVAAHNGATGAAVPMTVAHGYAFWDEANRLIVFQGVPNNGNIDITNLSYTDNDPVPEENQEPNFYDGWHFMGNPYPSYIDWSTISQSLTNLDNAVYVWDGSKYISFVNGQGDFSGEIAPMQGFFVHTNSDDGAYTLTNDCRIRSTERFYKKSSKAVKSSVSNTLKLSLNSDGQSDVLTIYTDYHATTGFDSRYDAIKMLGSSASVPYVYTVHGGVKYSIDALPYESLDNIVIPVGFSVPAKQQYTLRLESASFDQEPEIYLVDKVLDSTMQITPGFVYTFTANTTVNNQRFELRFYRPQKPVAKIQIGHLYVYEDKPFYKAFEKAPFADANNDKLSISVVDQKGNVLDWAVYDPEFNALYVAAGNDQVGDHDVLLKATDSTGLSAEIPFMLTVINVNDAPKLLSPMHDTTVFYEGEVYYNTAAYFEDVDKGDTLVYSAELADGSSLPEWLDFDRATGILHGYANDTGRYEINITATDKSGAVAQGSFTLNVKKVTFVDPATGLQIAVYPNPVVDILQVYNGEKQPAMITITDMNGKIIKRLTSDSQVERLDLRNLPSGNYLVKVEVNGQKFTRKIIKQ